MLDLHKEKLASGSRVPGPSGPLHLCEVREGCQLRSRVLNYNLGMIQS